MLYLFLSVGGLMLILSILFRVAAIFRVTIPLLYIFIAPTLFSGWFQANHALAEGLGYTLVGLTVLSWIISLVRKIREWQDDRVAVELFKARVDRAKAEGRSTVSTEDLYR